MRSFSVVVPVLQIVIVNQTNFVTFKAAVQIQVVLPFPFVLQNVNKVPLVAQTFGKCPLHVIELEFPGSLIVHKKVQLACSHNKITVNTKKVGSAKCRVPWNSQSYNLKR